MRGLLAATALTLVVAACGDDAGSTVPPVTDPPSTTATLAPATTSTTTATATTAAPTTLVPPPTTATDVEGGELPAGVSPIVAAGPNGIEILGGATLVPPIVDEPGVWVDAIPDGLGGLMYAAAGDAAQIIWWWPAGAAEPVLVSFKPGRLLHDVAIVDGRPMAVVVDNPDPSPEVEPESHLQLVDLETGDDSRTGLQVGGIEWGVNQVSHRDGVYLVTEVNHSCGDLYATDLAGGIIALPGLPEPPCAVHFEVPFSGAAFGPDGGYAYVVQHYVQTDEPGGTITGSELVVVDPEGTERARIDLGTGDEYLGEVDFDGRWAIVGGEFDPNLGVDGDPLLVDADGGTVTRVAGNGAFSFRFAPEPLQVGSGD